QGPRRSPRLIPGFPPRAESHLTARLVWRSSGARLALVWFGASSGSVVTWTTGRIRPARSIVRNEALAPVPVMGCEPKIQLVHSQVGAEHDVAVFAEVVEDRLTHFGVRF